MRARRVLVLVLLVGSVVLLPAAAGGARKPGFTTWTETFVDADRPTDAGVSTAAAPDRTLVTTLYRPTGKGPFPLVVFSHGLGGHPDKFRELLGTWAAAGYVVAAPAFPLTNDTVEGHTASAGDVVNQPADLSFVLDQVLREARTKGTRLHRAVDARRVGAAGLSLGGLTTYGVVFDDCCRDRRFTAAMVLDGIAAPLGGNGDELRLDGHVPLLIAHADTDPALPYSAARSTYRRASAPVWFVTLFGASHATQWEDDPTPYDRIAERLTTDFWDATLKGQRAGYGALQRHATVEGRSSIESRR